MQIKRVLRGVGSQHDWMQWRSMFRESHLVNQLDFYEFQIYWRAALLVGIMFTRELIAVADRLANDDVHDFFFYVQYTMCDVFSYLLLFIKSVYI